MTQPFCNVPIRIALPQRILSMKKLLFLFIAFCIFSCTGDEPETPARYELIPVETYQVPEALVVGNTYLIQLFYKLPTTCYVYNGIYFENGTNSVTAAIQSLVVEKQSCQPVVYPDYNPGSLPDQPKAVFEYYAAAEGQVHFKFWKGKNEQGQDTYHEITVPISN